jgi:shikimate dehydrogenase
VLLLGAGGAARGVLLPLLDQQPAEIVIANRTPDKAQLLVQEFRRRMACCAPAASTRSMAFRRGHQRHLGQPGTGAAAGAFCLLSPRATLAYDMMYGRDVTPFMRLAASHGADTRDGLGMLVEQAAESFFVWRGVRPDTAPVHQALRALL